MWKWIGFATSPFFLFSFACFFPQFFFRSLSGVQLDPSKAWCPMLDCQAVCSVTPGTEGKPLPVPCPVCHAVFCCGCRSPWIDGHSCSQHQPLMTPSADRSVWPIYHRTNYCLSFKSITCSVCRLCSALSSADTDAAIKQCPMCGVYIERNQGCAQMLCKSCKHTFCWYCLQNLDVSDSRALQMFCQQHHRFQTLWQ